MVGIRALMQPPQPVTGKRSKFHPVPRGWEAIGLPVPTRDPMIPMGSLDTDYSNYVLKDDGYPHPLRQSGPYAYARRVSFRLCPIRALTRHRVTRHRLSRGRNRRLSRSGVSAMIAYRLSSLVTLGVLGCVPAYAATGPMSPGDYSDVGEYVGAI